MMYRQGDLLIVKATDEQLKRRFFFNENGKVVRDNKYVLLEGETSGHYHGVSTEVAEYKPFLNTVRDLFSGNAVGLLEVKEPAELTHVGHHDSIEMAPGMYFVVRQREYDPGVGSEANLSRPVFD
jgi:hypothetical protein